MKRLLVFAAMFAVCGFVRADEEFKATCPVSGKAAKKSEAVDADGMKVYFCCGNCPDAYKADKEKFTAKVNYQLAQTKQIEQKACPFTGGKVKEGTEVKIGDVSVGFCCNNCKGKAEKAEGDDKKIELVFASTAKGFKKVEKKD
ncbi:MAG TPA: hypothetical protein VNC50_02205 [Planctomycetia bacterium]|nr:hypothetical protein [Planctomycetia bacterium]